MCCWVHLWHLCCWWEARGFIHLPLIHCITCSNVGVVICGYIALVEYGIVLDSDRVFLWPVYLIALGV